MILSTVSYVKHCHMTNKVKFSFKPMCLNVLFLLIMLVCASKYSGGSVMYYPDFHVSRNAAAAEKFENEFV